MMNFLKRIPMLVLFSGMAVVLSAWSESNPDSSKLEPGTIEKVGVIKVSSEQTSDSNDDHDHTVEGFDPDYIYAVDLYKSFGTDTQPFIFDVRNMASYEKSHIESALPMPYGKTTSGMLASVDGLNKSSEIVTYCGCPRHLSTLAAQNLTGRGYSNVKVLYEGYWHWIDNDYPIVTSGEDLADISRFEFRGQVLEDDSPIVNTDVFVVHRDTGQLEAARTDSKGNFQFGFHLYDYESGDQFELMLSSLDSTPVSVFSMEHSDNRIQFNL